ncbi:hypothetical protein GCM10027051_31210 [Niabella terrae]
MATTVKNYVSAIQSMDKRDIFPRIIDIQNNYGICDVMGAFGRYKPAKIGKVESFVNDALWKPGVVTGTPTGSGTATITVSLTAGSSGGHRLNDQVMFPDGKNGYVSAITPGSSDSVTIKSVDGTNLTAVATDEIKFFSNAVGEKSNHRESQFIGATHYYNLIQAFRENSSISDIQKMSKIEVTVNGVDVWTRKEYAEKFLKHKTEVNAAHIAGQISVSQFSTTTNALTDPGNGGIMQFERGLHQYVTAYGVNEDVATPGTVGIATDINDMIAGLVAKKADSNYQIWGSTASLIPFDVAIKNLSSSGVTSARMNMDGREINFEVDKFKFGGFNFQKMLLPILNQPEIFGNTIQAKGVYFIPEGNVKAMDSNQVATTQPRIQVRYLPIPTGVTNKGNGVWGEIHDGAFSEINPSGGEAAEIVSWITYQCIEVLGAQHFGFLEVNS